MLLQTIQIWQKCYKLCTLCPHTHCTHCVHYIRKGCPSWWMNFLLTFMNWIDWLLDYFKCVISLQGFSFNSKIYKNHLWFAYAKCVQTKFHSFPEHFQLKFFFCIFFSGFKTKFDNSVQWIIDDTFLCKSRVKEEEKNWNIKLIIMRWTTDGDYNSWTKRKTQSISIIIRHLHSFEIFH